MDIPYMVMKIEYLFRMPNIEITQYSTLEEAFNDILHSSSFIVDPLKWAPVERLKKWQVKNIWPSEDKKTPPEQTGEDWIIMFGEYEDFLDFMDADDSMDMRDRYYGSDCSGPAPDYQMIENTFNTIFNPVNHKETLDKFFLYDNHVFDKKVKISGPIIFEKDEKLFLSWSQSENYGYYLTGLFSYDDLDKMKGIKGKEDDVYSNDDEIPF